MLCDDNGGNFTYLETYAAKTAGSTKVSIKAKTLSRSYPVGSVLMIQSNDLTNVITGGVSQIVAGTNVTISPSGGTGVVTINSTGGGGSPSAPTNSVQYNDGGNFGGESEFKYFPTSNDLYVSKTNSTFYGTNNSGRTYFDENANILFFHLHAQDFNLGNSNAYFIVSDDGGNTKQNGYDKRAPLRIASTFLPNSYRIVAFECITSITRPLAFRLSTWYTGTSTIIITGDTNQIISLKNPHTIQPDEYFSINVVSDADKFEVFGARIYLTKV
tara:strand:- start:457 stop:1272 length:816 start_codon:yes stop_codon:yes gene_type:complete